MSQKFEKTKYTSIFKYQTTKGTRYRVRFSFVLDGIKEEYSKSGLLNLSQARELLATAELKLSKGQSPNEDESKKTFTLDQYYQKMREFKITSKKWNKNTIATNDGRWDMLKPVFGNMLLDRITRQDWQDWINEQYESNRYSQGTVEGFHSVLMLIINDAVEEDYLDKNRLKKVTLENENYKPKEKIVTMAEYEKAMQVAKDMLEPVHFTMFYMSTFGLRRGEVNGIRKDAIEFFTHDGKEVAKLFISTSRTRQYPEGNKTKTKKSDRFIIVNEYAANLLREQIKRAKQIKAEHDQIMNENDFIFLNPETANPFYIEIMNDQLKKVKKELGFNIHPHMMRHMFATAANIANSDGDALRDFMGHTDEAMTKRYTHPTEEAALKLLEQTDKILHRKL